MADDERWRKATRVALMTAALLPGGCFSLRQSKAPAKPAAAAPAAGAVVAAPPSGAAPAADGGPNLGVPAEITEIAPSAPAAVQPATVQAPTDQPAAVVVTTVNASPAADAEVHPASLRADTDTVELPAPRRLPAGAPGEAPPPPIDTKDKKDPAAKDPAAKPDAAKTDKPAPPAPVLSHYHPMPFWARKTATSTAACATPAAPATPVKKDADATKPAPAPVPSANAANAPNAANAGIPGGKLIVAAPLPGGAVRTAGGPQVAGGPGQPGGVVQAGMKPPPLPDPHQRPVPTASGELLNLPPGESPMERALALSAKLETAVAERKVVEAKAAELAAALDTRDKSVQVSGKEIQDAAEEVAKTRMQIQRWRLELEDARTKLQAREREDVETLKAIIALLEKMVEQPPAMEPKPEVLTPPKPEPRDNPARDQP